MQLISYLRLAASLVAVTASFIGSESFAQSERYMMLADSADMYIKRGAWEEAEKTLTAALRLEPANKMNVMLLNNLGVVYKEKHDYKKSLDTFDLAASMSPDSKSIRINRARTLLEINNESEAMRDLDYVLELDSLQEWSLRTRGLLLLSQGRYEAGIADLTLHQSHYSPDADLLSALGAASSALGKNNEAIEWYDKSISEAGSKEAWFARTLLKFHEGRLGDADDDLRRAIAIYPDFGDLYLLRAMIKKKNHLLSEAEEDRKTALRKGASPALALELLK